MKPTSLYFQCGGSDLEFETAFTTRKNRSIKRFTLQVNEIVYYQNINLFQKLI